MKAIDTKLNAMGVTDVRFVSPETASGPSGYIDALRSSGGTAWTRTDHLIIHNYGAYSSPQSNDAGKNYWVTETAANCGGCDTGSTPSQGEWSFASQTTDILLQDITNGNGSVLIYDAYDSFYYHHNSFGFWGLIAYNQNTGAYSARKRFYANAQVNRYIRPGAKRISLTESLNSVTQSVATYDSAAGKLTIVGYNSGSAATIEGAITNIPVSITSLKLYQTNSSTNMQAPGAGTAVPVSGGNFTVNIPADTIFTLTNY
jgi:O-glycosyl hydrolase